MENKIDAKAFETFAKKVFKLTDEEVAGLYNEAGELTDFSLIETRDTERMTKLSTDKTNQYNRGLKEGASKLEKEVKEKYEVESDLIGVELFDFVVEQKIEEATKNVQVNAEDIMKHPEVVKLINKHGKEIRDLKKEHETTIKAKEEEINYSSFMSEINSLALKEFHSLKPILSEDPVKAKNQERLLLDRINSGAKFRKDGDLPIVLKSDGTNMADEHGHPVTFGEYIKETAGTIFDFKAADDRSGSGNQDTSGQNQGSKKVRKPKDYDDYVSMMKDNSLTAKERIEIKNLAVEAKII